MSLGIWPKIITISSFLSHTYMSPMNDWRDKSPLIDACMEEVTKIFYPWKIQKFFIFSKICLSCMTQHD